MPKKQPTHPNSPWPKRLKTFRAKHKLSQAQAAQRAGVALRTWISWENWHRLPSSLALRLLSSAFPKDFKS